MGLLDMDFSDPQQAGLLALAQGLFAAGAPQTRRVGIGEALAGGLGNMHQAQMQAQQMKMADDFKNQQLALLKLKEQRDQSDFDNKQKLLSFISGDIGLPMGAANQPLANQNGGLGLSNQSTSQQGMPMQSPSSGLNMDIRKIAAASVAGLPGAKELLDIYKYQNDPRKLEAGSTYQDRITGAERYMPKIAEGGQIVNGQYQNIPGYVDSIGSIEGAKANATETAKAANDLVTVTSVDGRPRQMTRAQALKMTGGDQGQSDIGQGLDLSQLSPQQRQFLQKRDPEAFSNGVSGFNNSLVPNQPGIPLQSEAEKAASLGRANYTVEREKEKPVAFNAFQGSLAGLDRLAQIASEIKDNPALSRITGLTGKLPNMPGSDAANVQAKLETLKSEIGFSVLQNMRDLSKTGGALGAISDKENSMLQNNITALDTTQSPKEFAKSVDKVIQYAKGAQQRLANAYQAQYGDTQSNPSLAKQSSPPQQAINMLKMNPKLRAAFDEKYGAGASDSVLGK